MCNGDALITVSCLIFQNNHSKSFFARKGVTTMCFVHWIQVSPSSLTYFCCWYRHARSQSCPFCRDSLKRVNSGDLWIYMSNNEIDDMDSITEDNLKRLFMYVEKLPLIVPDPMFRSYPVRWWESQLKEN